MEQSTVPAGIEPPAAPTPAAPVARARPWLSRGLVWLFGVWCAATAALLALLQHVTADPVGRAIARMALGLVIIWIVGGGTISLLARRPAQRWLRRFARHWRLTFALGATALALLEEAVTTSMTNLAPLWDVPISKAHITASGNYLDVVLLHSVIVFVPMFITWSWLLARYDFAPSAVFILFGITGCLAEAGTFGLQNLTQAGFWVYVYGLMVWLPAYAAPPERGARKPGLVATLLAIILPIIAAIPVAIAVQAIHSAFFAGLP